MCIELQQLDGSRSRAPVSQASASLQLVGMFKRTLRLDLTTLRPGSTVDYLQMLGQETWEPGAQTVYQAPIGDETLLIPSQLLVLELLASHRDMRAHLLKPWSPGHLAAISTTAGGLHVAPIINRGTIKTETCISKMEWLLTYPSAHAAWGSVYRNGLRGRFDMQMPRAKVDLVADIRPVGSALLVTRLSVLALTPFEEPFEFASELARQKFIFFRTHNERALAEESALSNAKKSAGSMPTTGPLTDSQWLRVEVLLNGVLRNRGRPRAYPLRQLVNAVLLKVGTPYAWKSRPANKSLAKAAWVFLTLLQRLGIWERILMELKETDETSALEGRVLPL